MSLAVVVLLAGLPRDDILAVDCGRAVTTLAVGAVALDIIDFSCSSVMSAQLSGAVITATRAAAVLEDVVGTSVAGVSWRLCAPAAGHTHRRAIIGTAATSTIGASPQHATPCAWNITR